MAQQMGVCQMKNIAIIKRAHFFISVKFNEMAKDRNVVSEWEFLSFYLF